MPLCLVTPTVLRNIPGLYSETLRQGGFEVIYPPAGCDTMVPATLIEQLAGIDAILASTEPLNRQVLSAVKLRVIARMGVGYDAVDVPAATDFGVAVAITPGTLEDSVAEHTIALMLGVSRGLFDRDREVRQGAWTRAGLPRMAGKTFGVIGLGRIGRAVAEKVQALGMQVIAVDPFADQEYARGRRIQMVTLPELFKTADVVSIHSPSTADTVNLINRETLALMKPTAIFINTARGALVDEDALCDALEAGHLLGAGLDVFKIEPLPLTSRLLRAPRVILATHTAGLDNESQIATSNKAAQNIVDLYQGKWPEGAIINRQLKDGWKW